MSDPKVETQALSLEDIIQCEVPPIFRRQHLNRDVIICIIGDRGGGKTLSGGLISLLDYMLQGEPCFSNTTLKATFDVDEATAAKYGLQAGEACFESKPLNKHKFLRFAPEYRGGVFFTHEFNVWLADARRSMSTLNLEVDDVGQQLRKLQSAWVLDCIHEMFIDPRIRDAVDIYIKTNDTALTPEGLAARKPQGIEFEWWIYPMTTKLTGHRYQDTGERIGPIYIRGKPLWGLIDTLKREVREKYKANVMDTPVNMEITHSPAMIAAEGKYGWVYDKIKALHDEGVEEIHSYDLWAYLDPDEKGFNRSEIGKVLTQIGIRRRGCSRNRGGFYFYN